MHSATWLPQSHRMAIMKHPIVLAKRSMFNAVAQIMSATTKRKIAGAETMLQAREALSIVKDAVKGKRQQLAALPSAESGHDGEASAVDAKQQLADEVVQTLPTCKNKAHAHTDTDIHMRAEAVHRYISRRHSRCASNSRARRTATHARMYIYLYIYIRMYCYHAYAYP